MKPSDSYTQDFSIVLTEQDVSAGTIARKLKVHANPWIFSEEQSAYIPGEQFASNTLDIRADTASDTEDYALSLALLSFCADEELKEGTVAYGKAA